MKIVTITGFKGGVGKSTTAIHLATYFSEKGRTVLIDGDPNRTAIAWAERGAGLPFEVVDQRQAMKAITNADFIVIDTPARPDSDDLKELAKGCDAHLPAAKGCRSARGRHRPLMAARMGTHQFPGALLLCSRRTGGAWRDAAPPVAGGRHPLAYVSVPLIVTHLLRR